MPVKGIAIFALVAIAGLSGCAAKHRPAQELASEEEAVLAGGRENGVASALVFEAPVAIGQPPLDLSREGRGASAFVGYAEGVAEFFYVRWDDRQTNGRFDRYERRAVSEKVGVLYR